MDELWQECEAILRKRALRIARSRVEADDLVQEAFVCALTHPELLDYDRDHQLAWLTRAMRSRLVDSRRHERVEQNFLALPRASETSTDDLTMVEVRQVLGLLPSEQSRLLSLRYLAGWNATQIAELLHVSPATVRTRLRAAVKKLRQLQYERD